MSEFNTEDMLHWLKRDSGPLPDAIRSRVENYDKLVAALQRIGIVCSAASHEEPTEDSYFREILRDTAKRARAAIGITEAE